MTSSGMCRKTKTHQIAELLPPGSGSHPSILRTAWNSRANQNQNLQSVSAEQQTILKMIKGYNKDINPHRGHMSAESEPDLGLIQIQTQPI